VTGASRGIGAEAAIHLADPNTHVIVNYRESSAQAEAVAETIRAAGGRASTAQADVSDGAAVAAMIDDIALRFGRLDVLVLNASGRFNYADGAGAAMRINRIAQRRLAQLALPFMPAGGQIVFVTSHQAHFYPNKAVPKGYTSLAAGKRAGETTLHAMRSEFHQHGIDFTVVSAEILTQPRPTEDEFAAAISGAASSHHSGIVYVSRHLDRRSA
jgi:NAD(P)-dependent dehydrogenase (short-subunit alcohol dehydrogenase family)